MADLSWNEFADEALLQGLMQSGLSEQMASINIVEIGRAIREGALFEDYHKNKSHALGHTRFSDFAKEFALVYQQHR